MVILFHNITVYYNNIYFYCIIDQINAAVVSMRHEHDFVDHKIKIKCKKAATSNEVLNANEK